MTVLGSSLETSRLTRALEEDEAGAGFVVVVAFTRVGLELTVEIFLVLVTDLTALMGVEEEEEG